MSGSTHHSLNRRNFMKYAAGTEAVAFAMSIKPIFSDSEKRIGEWYETIYRQFHIDYEFEAYREIFKGFNAEATAQIFEEAGIQMVSYFAKCASGYSYYPTMIGMKHPGLNMDFTGEMWKSRSKSETIKRRLKSVTP